MAKNNSGDVSSRRLGDLLTDIEEERLIVRPLFQRRLVWTNVVKDSFLDTVLNQYPFPEIFIAAGELDETKLKRKKWLVDGQQRLSTLREYVLGSKDLVLKKVKPYAELSENEKTAFSDYTVAVRDLGAVTEDQVKDIFSRINSADYSLKKIERLNAQYSGEFKQFCDQLSRHEFFVANNIFSTVDIRRMRDLDFCVILAITLLSNYFHRDEKNDEYLKRYNDDFPDADSVMARLDHVFSFINEMRLFEESPRSKKKTDLFTLLVELDAAINRSGKVLEATQVSAILRDFYSRVDARYKQSMPVDIADDAAEIDKYLKAATKATNDKYAREARAQVIGDMLG